MTRILRDALDDYLDAQSELRSIDFETIERVDEETVARLTVDPSDSRLRNHLD